MSKLNLDKLRAVLLDAIIEKHNVSTLFQCVYTCIDLPIISFDVSFTLIAYAFPRPFYYTHWENLAKRGKAPIEVVEANDYLIYQEIMSSKRKSEIFDWGTCEGFPQAAGPIFQKDRLIGYVGIMLEDTNPQTALQANDMIAETIALLLQSPNPTSTETLSKEDLAERTLLATSISPELANQLKQQLSPPYILTILSANASSVSTLQYVRSNICTGTATAIGCLNGEKYLYILHGNVQSADDMAAIKKSFEKIASKYKFRGGISDYFHEPQSLFNHRMQAVLSLFVGSQEKLIERITSFQEHYGIVLNYYAMEWFGSSACRLPVIDILAKEDAEKGSKYLETLEVYLRNFRKHSAAARVLGLHKNTILHRMQKIRDIIGIDFDDSLVADKLLTGIEIHHMQSHPDFNSKGGVL